jgi:hypothetical protein
MHGQQNSKIIIQYARYKHKSNYEIIVLLGRQVWETHLPSLVQPRKFVLRILGLSNHPISHAKRDRSVVNS